MRYEKLPIPFGWYGITFCAELATGEVKALEYFGQSLVLYRTESGTAVVHDAFCPHLGAHLGHGGVVKGENISCPFHGWRFGADGKCQVIDYAKKVPTRAQEDGFIRTYPVVERNGMIYAWYHPHSAEPLFEVEDIPELMSGDWDDTPVAHERFINCHIQDSQENAVDGAHFIYVHGSEGLPEGEMTMEGHTRRTDVTMTSLMPSEDGTLGGENSDVHAGRLVTANTGPGISWTIFEHDYIVFQFSFATPITRDRFHLRTVFLQPKKQSGGNREIAAMHIEHVMANIDEDTRIWDYKIYQEKPTLCDGDGPIMKYRKWFKQFYATA